MRIGIIGAGYVGSALAVSLSRAHDVTVFDIDFSKSARIEELNSHYLGKAHFVANANEAIDDKDFIVLCVPTDYDEKTHRFDVSAVESSLRLVAERKAKGSVVIKSTVPVGFTVEAMSRYPSLTLMFSPEFLRETSSVEDCLNPSRVVVGRQEKDAEEARKFASALTSIAETDNVHVLYVGPSEAEAIKLFSNTYLALRVAYFNELDTYAMYHGLSAEDIIAGVTLDPRIGAHYRNPSFGYGGYCLPKDTKQLLHNFESVPQNLVESVIKSNATRKQAIAREILKQAKAKKDNPRIGIYSLAMKKGSDNFRQSAVVDILDELRQEGADLVVYEPKWPEEQFHGVMAVKDFKTFCEQSDIIVANRMDDALSPYSNKVFTRDIYRKD